MYGGVGDDTRAFIGFGFASLKLWLNQRDDISGREQQCNYREENFAQGDKGAIDDGEVKGDKRLREMRWQEVAGVSFLHNYHTRVLAKFPGKLTPTDVDGKNGGSAVLEEAIGETAGGSADIDGAGIAHVEVKMVNGMFEFEPAATDILLGCDAGDEVGGLNGIARFAGGMAVDEDLGGQNGALGLLAGFAKAQLNQHHVQAFH